MISYITTGSRVPDGANAVVKVEDTRSEGGFVTIKVDVKDGENIRLVGSDIRFFPLPWYLPHIPQPWGVDHPLGNHPRSCGDRSPGDSRNRSSFLLPQACCWYHEYRR
jgi:hypothetical protein